MTLVEAIVGVAADEAVVVAVGGAKCACLINAGPGSALFPNVLRSQCSEVVLEQAVLP